MSTNNVSTAAVLRDGTSDSAISDAELGAPGNGQLFSAHCDQRRSRPPGARRRARILFAKDGSDRFLTTVKARVDDYFVTTGKHRRSDWRLWAKGAFYAALVVGSYSALLTAETTRLGYLGLAIVFGLSALLLAINVAHDCAHHAATGNHLLDDAMQTIIFTIVGANAYLWRLRHVKSHHALPNVNGCDVDIDETTFMLLSPNHQRRWYHRYQHIYGPFVFWLVDVDTVFYKDFVYLFKRELANMTEIRHPWWEYILFILSKMAYICVVFVVPALVLPLPWWEVVIGALIMTFIMSALFVTLLIGTHFAEETVFPEVGPDGNLGHSWAEHALLTSIDWSPTSRIANFITGGANAHAAHHLFPTVSHVHYIPLSRIIKDTAREFGLPYNQTTLPRLVQSHFRYLRRVGRGDVQPYRAWQNA